MNRRQCSLQVYSDIGHNESVCRRCFHTPLFIVVWAWSCWSPKHKSDSRSINYSTKGRNGGSGCALFNMANHSQSSHMYHQLQNRIMNQLCLLTVTVRLSAGQLECAARPWPPQSCCGQPLNRFPLPLSISPSHFLASRYTQCIVCH